MTFRLTAMLLLVPPLVHAANFNCEDYHRDGYRLLRSTQNFSELDIDRWPASVKELVCILRREDASRILEQVVKTSQPGGKLLALSGLYIADRAAYERLADPLRKDDTPVVFLSGDVLTDRTVGQIVTSGIDPGHLPKQLQAKLAEFDRER